MKTDAFDNMANSLALALVCASLLTAPCAVHAASGRIFMFTTQTALENGPNSFGDFLRSLGYTVTVLPDPGVSPYEILDVIGSTNAALQAQLIAELTDNYDLIIIHRSYGSGVLAGSEAERAIWNNLNVPILCCNAPYVRSDRWMWVNTPNSGSLATYDRRLIFLDPQHPILAGLNTDLFVTNNAAPGYGGFFPAADGGPHMKLLAQVNMPFNPYCLAVWDENPGEVRSFYQAGGQTYVRRRVFFELPDYRSGGSWASISWNGRRLVANVVAYAMTGSVPPAPPAIGDFFPPDGSQHNTTVTAFGFQTTSPQPIPTSGIRVLVNGQDVSDDLEFFSTDAGFYVTYEGLEPNQVYNISITVSNATGIGEADVQFDTFDPSIVRAVYQGVDGNFTGEVNTGTWRLFLQVLSSTPQVVTLTSSNAVEQPWGARLQGVFYLPGSMNTFRLIPLTDAFGIERVVRLPTDIITFIPGPMTGVSMGGLYLVPVLPTPETLQPTLGLASPYPRQIDVSPLAGLDLHLVDGDTPVMAASLRLFVDGTDVTGTPQTTVSDTDSGVRVQHSPPTFLAPGQAHTVTVVYADSSGHTFTNQYRFQTVAMPALPPSLALPLSAGVARGFNVRLHLAPTNTDPVFTNTAARAELQLAGLLVGPSGPVTNEITGTPQPAAYIETNVINYSQDGTAQGQLGGDILFPYGSAVYPSHIAMEAIAWLQLPAGLVTFGVASDDGFKLTAGYDTNLVLGAYHGTRGPQVPTEFEVLVYQPGLYPVRLLYYDGGGGASVEFYTVNNTNATSTRGRVLVNGPDDLNQVPVPAYSLVQPRLTIERQGAQIVISWCGAGHFRLQQTQDLDAPVWTPVGQEPIVEGLRHSVSLALPDTGRRFYRLVWQQPQ
jgi:hypothetical protein